MAVAPNREELAWAAGFFDGEGCTYASAAGRAPCISVAQVDPEPLYRFQRAVFGLGYVRTETKSYGARKPAHRFRAGKFEHVQAIMAALWPFLGEAKKRQYSDITAAWLPNARAPNKRNKSWSTKQQEWYRVNRRRILTERRERAREHVA